MAISQLLFFQKPIIYLNAVSSTNDFIKEYVSEKSINYPIIVFSEYQTKGRGQRSKYWESNSGENLLFSLYLPELGMKTKDLNVISQSFYIEIADWIDALLHQNLARIKWPNDIILQDKKMGGILLETTINQDKLDSLILGVGLNINQTHFPKELPNASSLAMLCPEGKWSREEIFEKLLRRLEGLISEWQIGNPSQTAANYHRYLYKFNSEVSIKKGEDVIRGIHRGVNDSGHWMIERIDNGELMEIRSSGEVEFIYGDSL